jgi:hypothetical protein
MLHGQSGAVLSDTRPFNGLVSYWKYANALLCSCWNNGSGWSGGLDGDERMDREEACLAAGSRRRIASR